MSKTTSPTVKKVSSVIARILVGVTTGLLWTWHPWLGIASLALLLVAGVDRIIAAVEKGRQG